MNSKHLIIIVVVTILLLVIFVYTQSNKYDFPPGLELLQKETSIDDVRPDSAFD
jgi:hypothetical protein